MINTSTDSIFLSFLMIGILNFLGVISPGPDFALIVKTSLSHHRKQAIFTAIGLALGVLVHVTYCIFGLAFIITQSPFIFSLIKYIGAAYFIYIGIQCLLAKKPDPTVVTQNQISVNPWRAIQSGFLCNVLNPKAMLFFLGLFTLAIQPDTPLWIQALFGIEMAIITFSWFAFLSIIITHQKIKAKMTRFQYIITKFMGAFLIFFGIQIGFIR